MLTRYSEGLDVTGIVDGVGFFFVVVVFLIQAEEWDTTEKWLSGFGIKL